LRIIVTLLAAAAAGAHAADAKAVEALVKSSGYLACHAEDKRLVGPSYQEIADRYRKDKAAEGNLVQKVKAGGKGVWGDIPMPPNAHVKDADIKTLVQWVLSIK